MEKEYLIYDENIGAYRYEDYEFVKEHKNELQIGITVTGDECLIIPYSIYEASKMILED